MFVPKRRKNDISLHIQVFGLLETPARDLLSVRHLLGTGEEFSAVCMRLNGEAAFGAAVPW